MLLICAGLLAVVALFALVARPAIGVALVFFVRPIVDATWSMPIVLDFNLPRLMGVLVPSIVVAHLLIGAKGEARFRHMPLKLPWLLFSGYVVVFSAIMLFVQGSLDGLEVLFRHLNGIVGFYMIQAFYHRAADVRRLMLVIAAAGIFPVAVGLYQQATGVQWAEGQAEGLTRLVGLYHDAYTVRYVMMQTLLALTVYVALHPRMGHARFAIAVGYGIAALAVLFKAYSKSGFVALAGWVLIWGIYRRRFWTLGAAGSVGAIGLAYFAQDAVADVAQLFVKELSALTGQGDLMHTFAGRWYGWNELWDAWLALDPLAQVFGSGQKATGAHNDFLQMLYHGGIVGLALYVALLAAVITRVVGGLRQGAGPLDIAALMALSLWLIDSIGLVPSSYPGYQWFVWGFVGLALRARTWAPVVADEPAKRRPAPIVFRGLRESRSWRAIAGQSL